MSQCDLEKKQALVEFVRKLIAEGKALPTPRASTMWKPVPLAKWYGQCRRVSDYLGPNNVWKDLLCAWDWKIGDDKTFHAAMLGTLEAIVEHLDYGLSGPMDSTSV
ncbi:MAG: hypothetical protein JW818_21630 [Pirellulales bacterium]|nr:hypothetical protein [Pirellulales bacterium]